MFHQSEYCLIDASKYFALASVFDANSSLHVSVMRDMMVPVTVWSSEGSILVERSTVSLLSVISNLRTTGPELVMNSVIISLR